MARSKNETTSVLPTQADEIARIRDILFGSHMKEYERRFRNIEEELGRQKKRIEELWQRVDDLEAKVDQNHRHVLAELRKQVDDLYTQLQRRIDQLEEESVAKVTLGDLLLEVGSRIKGSNVTTSLQEILKDHE